jgi:hypothetical protein
LRAFGFQSDIGYAPAVSGASYHWLFADSAIQYALPYLSEKVTRTRLPFPLGRFYLFIEFNYSQAITGPSGQTLALLDVTPGLAHLGGVFWVSMAGRFSLNRAAASTVNNRATIPNNHSALLLLLDLFLDDIFSAASWKPF